MSEYRICKSNAVHMFNLRLCNDYHHKIIGAVFALHGDVIVIPAVHDFILMSFDLELCVFRLILMTWCK